MRYSVSDTAEHGDYIAGVRVVNQGTRQEMKKLLSEIQDGSFAAKWIKENEDGRPNFNARRKAEQTQLLEEVGAKLRGMMPFLNPVTHKPEDLVTPAQPAPPGSRRRRSGACTARPLPTTRMPSSPPASPFAALLDFLPDVLAWVKDRQGRYLWVNRAFVVQYSLDARAGGGPPSAATLLGKTDYDLSPAFLADQFRHDEQVVAGHRTVNRLERLEGRTPREHREHYRQR
jgi:PAS domain-containing protein